MSNNQNIDAVAGDASLRFGTAVDEFVNLVHMELGNLHTQLEEEASESHEECFASEAAPLSFIHSMQHEGIGHEMCGVCRFAWPDSHTACDCGFTIISSKCKITKSGSDEPRKERWFWVDEHPEKRAICNSHGLIDACDAAMAFSSLIGVHEKASHAHGELRCVVTVSEEPLQVETPKKCCFFFTFEWPDSKTECECGLTIITCRCPIAVDVPDEPIKEPGVRSMTNSRTCIQGILTRQFRSPSGS